MISAIRRRLSGWDLLILLVALAVAVQSWRHGASIPQAALQALSLFGLVEGAMYVADAAGPSSTAAKPDTTTRKGSTK